MDPFLHLDRVRSSPSSCRRVVPLSQLGTDLARGRLPRFAMVTPDLAHDMHDGSIGQADAFLRRLDHQLLASPARRGGILLVVTFDEAPPTAASTDGPLAGTSPPSWSVPASRPAAGTRPPTITTPCSARSSSAPAYSCCATPPTGKPG
jgi:hypothetical protein